MVVERTSRLEGAYEQADRRMESIDRRLDAIQLSIETLRADTNKSIEALRADMNAQRADTNSRFNTLYVLLFGSWATIVAAVIGLYIRG